MDFRSATGRRSFSCRQATGPERVNKMYNTVSTSARISDTWRALIDHFKVEQIPATTNTHSLAEVFRAMGRTAIETRGTTNFHDDLCSGIILACIDKGLDTRDDIIKTVPKYAGATYRYIAMFLDKRTGSSPEHDLWSRREDGKYFPLGCVRSLASKDTRQAAKCL